MKQVLLLHPFCFIRIKISDAATVRSEILMPPLSGLEVLGQGEDVDGTLVYNMGLNINLRSMTIEQVLAIRKKQVRELAKMVHKDIDHRRNIGDIPSRLAAITRLDDAIATEDVNVFNVRLQRICYVCISFMCLR